jgi:putative transport protein
LQLGPGFLASLRRQGLPLNLMAAAIVFLGAGITLSLHKAAGIPLPTAVGLLSGATTNTPSLAAAQEAIVGIDATLKQQPVVGYALAYPFGIVGIIATMILMRAVFRVDVQKEQEAISMLQSQHRTPLVTMNLEIKNPNLEGLPLRRIRAIRDCGVVISRIMQGGKIEVARPTTVVRVGDVLHAVGQSQGLDELRVVVGAESQLDLKALPSDISQRRIIVTKSHALGKTVEELNLLDRFQVTATRVGRGEVEMSPASGAKLQFGDTLRIVGAEEAIEAVAEELGDSAKQLNHPRLVPMFLGIALGVVLGSWTIPLPGMPAPLKLGLAGGPLVVAIVLSRIGHIGPLVWYMPASANFMVRELGIVLFLSCVGLASGNSFFRALMPDGTLASLLHSEGLRWMLYASLITLVPLLVVALVARMALKVNYLTLCGLLAGSMTDPPALAFAGAVTGSDAPSVSYATVYPLTMLLRVFVAQALVLAVMG